MAETNLGFSKIVATPTLNAWSQAYSAGRLFAVFSLQIDNPQEGGGEEGLAAIGKDLISTFESEFFTLETKGLDSIKQALLTTVARVREGITVSFVVCFLNENVLYLFATNGGKAVLKRGEKIGSVLEGEEGNSNIKSASGYAQPHDIIVLQTKTFHKVIGTSILAGALDSNDPDEISETLAPHIHEKTEGAASALILIYKEQNGDAPVVPSDVEKETEKESEEIKNLSEETISEEKIPSISTGDQEAPVVSSETGNIPQAEEIPAKPSTQTPASPFLTDQVVRKRRISFSLGFLKKFSDLPRQRKIILTIAITLLAVILITSFLALNNRSGNQNEELFNSVYNEAQTKYEEGQNLKDLNAPLAAESFKEAQKLLSTNVGKFETGSLEKSQIETLLNQINKELESSTNGENMQAKEVEKSESKFLSYELDNPNASYFTENEDNVFFVDGSGISRIDKGNDKKTQIVKKTWKKEGGIGSFGSNVYVLDKENGILKFVPSGANYSESNYLTGDEPDFSNSSAIAIDGSIYVLFNDGTIKKFTKGTSDTFSVSGLSKPMSGPTRIFTGEDTDNIYVLDNGNSRVVVLGKDGKFQKAYSANVLKAAKDFDVDEVGKKILILSGGKVYQIDIK